MLVYALHGRNMSFNQVPSCKKNWRNTCIPCKSSHEVDNAGVHHSLNHQVHCLYCRLHTRTCIQTVTCMHGCKCTSSCLILFKLHLIPTNLHACWRTASKRCWRFRATMYLCTCISQEVALAVQFSAQRLHKHFSCNKAEEEPDHGQVPRLRAVHAKQKKMLLHKKQNKLCAYTLHMQHERRR